MNHPDTTPHHRACHGCAVPVHEEEINWARPDGSLSVDDGDPYCDACLPPEEDTTPQDDPFIARSQEEADAEFEAAMDLVAHQWGMPAGAPAARVVSEMDARGMSIVPDEMSYQGAAACAIALGIDPGHGDEDDTTPQVVRLGSTRCEWATVVEIDGGPSGQWCEITWSDDPFDMPTTIHPDERHGRDALAAAVALAVSMADRVRVVPNLELAGVAA